MPFTPIDVAVEAFARGEFLVVVDDEDRENEGDLVIAAQMATPDAINFMANPATDEQVAHLQDLYEKWTYGLPYSTCRRRD